MESVRHEARFFRLRNIFVILIMLLLFTAASGQEPVNGDGIPAEHIGTVEDTATVELPEDYYVYRLAYVAEADDVAPEEITAWEPVEVDAALQSPPETLTVETDDQVMFQGAADVDLSSFEAGEYYLLFWGCPEEGGECVWLEPFRVQFNPVSVVDVYLSGHMTAGENPNSLAPEQTLMSIEVAEAVGIDSAEFDVKLTADNELVVFHDANAEEVTGVDLEVSQATLDELTQLAPTANYEYIEEAEHAVPPEQAEEARVASLDEMLERFAASHQIEHIRVDIKYPIDNNHRDSARDLYNAVERHGLADQAVFMQFGSDCSASTNIGLASLRPSNLVGESQITRGCTYPALDAIQDESGGSATTVVMWQNRRNALEAGGLTSDWQLYLAYPLEEAIQHADEQGYDIVSARDSYTQICFPDRWYLGALSGYCMQDIGIQGVQITRDEFVEDVQSRGMGYAFMSYTDGTEDLLDNYPDVEWLSADRIDLLKAAYDDYREERGLD